MTIRWAIAHDAQLQVAFNSIEIDPGHQRSAGVAGTGIPFLMAGANLVSIHIRMKTPAAVCGVVCPKFRGLQQMGKPIFFGLSPAEGLICSHTGRTSGI